MDLSVEHSEPRTLTCCWTMYGVRITSDLEWSETLRNPINDYAPRWERGIEDHTSSGIHEAIFRTKKATIDLGLDCFLPFDFRLSKCIVSLLLWCSHASSMFIRSLLLYNELDYIYDIDCPFLGFPIVLIEAMRQGNPDCKGLERTTWFLRLTWRLNDWHEDWLNDWWK